MSSPGPLHEQVELIASGAKSAREALGDAIARIEAVDRAVGAFLTVDVEGARRRAAELDDALARAGVVGPLHGVPVAVKDLTSTAGLTTTFGSAAFADHVPTEDAPAVSRLRAAGAVLIGKTNTPEFGLGAETVTAIGPRCNNPWNVERTSGGSSGGTAAALASDMVAAGIGSDAGGSIRLPSAWCGVVGLKPTFGRVPNEPPMRPADHPSSTVGPMARSVADVALLLGVIAGHDSRDPASERIGVPEYVSALDGNCTLRWGTDLGMGVADPAITEILVATMERTAALGNDVSGSSLDVGVPHPFLVVWDLIAAASAARYGHLAGEHELMDYTMAFVESGRAMSATRLAESMFQARRLRALVDDELEHCDALALPATAVSAWPHGAPPATVNGAPAAAHGGITYGGLPYLALANVTGHPAIVVPAGFDDDGLPVGIQLIGGRFGEAALLRAASRVAEASDQPSTGTRPSVT